MINEEVAEAVQQNETQSVIILLNQLWRNVSTLHIAPGWLFQPDSLIRKHLLKKNKACQIILGESLICDRYLWHAKPKIEVLLAHNFHEIDKN